MGIEGTKAGRELMDSKEVADLLGISWRQVQRLAKTGAIPALKVGKLWRFPRGRLLSFCGIDEG